MSNLAMILTAELAFKCCEKGMNWEATRAKICSLMDNPAEIMRPDWRASTAAVQAAMHPGVLPWRPIEELTEETRQGDERGFLLLAPELVDEDCNVCGVGMGHWQDDGLLWNATQAKCDARDDDVNYGCWLACQWSMTNDEWAHVPCTPTYYLRLTGVRT